MQQPISSPSSSKIAQSNHSILAFRKMIQNLRVKNKSTSKISQPCLPPQISVPKPTPDIEKIMEVKNSIDSNIDLEKDLIMRRTSHPILEDGKTRNLKIWNSSARKNQFNSMQKSKKSHDQNLSKTFYLKTNSSNKKSQVCSQTTEQEQFMRNTTSKRLQPYLPRRMQNSRAKFSNISNNNMENKISSYKSDIKPMLNENLSKISSMMAMQNFQTRTTNLSGSQTNKIKDLNEKIIRNFYKQAQSLSQTSKAKQIMAFFKELMTFCRINIGEPFIKKFKNCAYFGEPISEKDSYEGFLYYFEEKIYYGEFIKNKKNGKGTQIDFKNQIVYKGIFQEGQKTGKFLVQKQNQKYNGFLEKGVYQGQGKLQTKSSIYQGEFDKGQKHGYGCQYFPKTGVKIIGYFDQGIFHQREKSNIDSRARTMSQIKGIKFKAVNKSSKIIQNQQKNLQIISKNQAESFQSQGKHLKWDQNTNKFISPYTNFKMTNTLYNKQKIQSFLSNIQFNNIKSKNTDSHIDSPLGLDSNNPQNFTSSKVESIPNSRLKENQKNNQEEVDKNMRVEEQVLPIPCFYKKQ